MMAGLPAGFAGPICNGVEQLVSGYRGRPWRAGSARDLADLASHPAAILSDGVFSVFVKVSTAADGPEQFETELASLQLLSQRAGVRTPTAIGALAVEGGAVLVLEALEAEERGPCQWREIGQTLGRMHCIQAERFGLETHGYFGHPEIDLALVDYFYAVPPDVFEGYQEEMPIEAGFAERRELWRVFAYLAVITVDGGSFVDRLSAAVRQYL
jgi:fructosamine-3-kinase